MLIKLIGSKRSLMKRTSLPPTLIVKKSCLVFKSIKKRKSFSYFFFFVETQRSCPVHSLDFVFLKKTFVFCVNHVLGVFFPVDGGSHPLVKNSSAFFFVFQFKYLEKVQYKVNLKENCNHWVRRGQIVLFVQDCARSFSSYFHQQFSCLCQHSMKDNFCWQMCWMLFFPIDGSSTPSQKNSSSFSLCFNSVLNNVSGKKTNTGVESTEYIELEEIKVLFFFIFF